MRAAILAFAALLFSFAAHAALQNFDTAPLAIDTASGPHSFTVELALTAEQQEQGLMYRPTLATDAGMLFIFPDTRQAHFWMKNTLIPLDMLFIGPDGTVLDMHQRAVPLSTAVIASAVPVKAVLELNGGTVARLGIKVGDIVHAKVFGNLR